MKKSIGVLLGMLVIFSGCGVAVSSLSDQKSYVSTETITFSPLHYEVKAAVTSIWLPEGTSTLSTPGEYPLPVVTKVFTLPFLSKISDIVINYAGVEDIILSQPLQPVSQPIADDFQRSTKSIDAIKSMEVCPANSYSTHIGAGRNGDALATFFSVHLYPVQYLPTEGILRCAKTATITFRYTVPETKTTVADQYDLLIITADKFAETLQPLVAHKNSVGITTKLVTREEICDSVFFPAEGRDCAEEMKYFIKNAFDSWGIKYVLLVGGRSGGLKQEKWLLPVRYSNLDDIGETSYLSDLYFADLYDVNGNFSSWDSNNDGVFAEWTSTKKDILDMYPEVFVGRLPCTSVAQVRTMVEKIIVYENTTNGSDWFHRFIGIAGDTYPAANDPYFEGEMATSAAFEQLQDLGFSSDMVWTSNGRFTDADSIITAMNIGSGFVHFSGHGNPNNWANHPPQNETFIQGPNSFQMVELANGDKQPIVIVGGCHNAQFNTHMLNMAKGILSEGLRYFSWKNYVGGFWYKEWIPRCWAWSMASQGRGGAIAVIANSGLGYGEPGEHTLTEKGRFLEWLFFKAYRDGKIFLGETHAADLMYYMEEHAPMEDQIDCKIIQEWVLLGDPSLRIGGYPS